MTIACSVISRPAILVLDKPTVGLDSKSVCDVYSPVNQLTKPYPPHGYWIYESDAIHNQWEDHIKYGKCPSYITTFNMLP